MSRPFLLAIIVYAGLIALSDAILFAFFIIPYVLYYFLYARQRRSDGSDADKNKKRVKTELLRKEKNRKTDAFAVALLLVTGMATIYKFVQPAFLNDAIPAYVVNSSYESPIVSNLSVIIANVQLYFLSLALLVSESIYNILSARFSVPDVILAFAFLAIIAYSISRINKMPEYVARMMLLSIIVVFISFTVTNFANDGASIASRFLIFTAVTLFAFMAMAYDNKNDKQNLLFVSAVIILIALVAASNVVNVKTLDFAPNSDQYRLIDHLEKNNGTFGLSSYSDANLITYLSKEKVILREVKPQVVNGRLKMNINTWLVSNRYYPEVMGILTAKTNDTHFIITTNTNDPLYANLNQTFKLLPPASVSYYENYVIGYYNKSVSA